MNKNNGIVTSSPPPLRYGSIDGLRTFGCLAIIAWHVMWNSGVQLNDVFCNKVVPSWNFLVYLFMIVSGFGMCNGYYEKVKSGNYDVNNFYKKRYQKNLPFFALLILINLLMDHDLSSMYEGLMEITMLFGFLPNNTLSVIGVSWTLGTIFAFYIIFPYFVFLIYNKKRAWFSFVASLLITYMCSAYFMTDKFVQSSFVPRHSFLYCLSYFLGGGLIYLYRNEIESILRKRKLVYGIVCIAVTILYYVIPDEVNGTSLIVVKTLILYLLWFCFAIGDEVGFMSNKFTKLISGISMEMYLAHMVFFRVIEKLNISRFLGNGYVAYIATYLLVLISLIVAIKLYQMLVRTIREKLQK